MDNNSQLSKGSLIGNSDRGKGFEIQNTFPDGPSQKSQETLRTIDSIANQNLITSEKRDEVPLEMPPGEDAEIPKTESDKANLKIRGYGDNGKFGNGNYDDMKKTIVAASEDPYSLNNAIDELSREVSGLGKVA